MNSTATNRSYARVMFKHTLSDTDLHSPDLVEESMTLDLPYGTLDTTQWYFDGIRIRSGQHRFKNRFYFEKENIEDIVSLQFNLQGNFVIAQTGQTYRVRSQQHNIVYSKGFGNTFENKDLFARTFAVDFSTELFLQLIDGGSDILKKFADKMLAGKPVVLAKDSLPMTFDLQRAIHDILTCRYAGGLKKLFLLSKSIEILVLQTEACERVSNTKTVYCKSEADKERIMHARELLVQNLESPPSLSELAKEAGLNEFKLKKGFKEMFGATVFDYLSSHRLEMARQTLLDTRKTISEIAYEFGYSSPQHFSTAFRKKFGSAPKFTRK